MDPSDLVTALKMSREILLCALDAGVDRLS
jgi:hypothetical protein